MAEVVELNGEYFVSFYETKDSDFEFIGDGLHGPFPTREAAEAYIKQCEEDI